MPFLMGGDAESNKVKSIKSEIIDVSNDSCSRVKFDGHIYIIYRSAYQNGITHDPDCPCNN